MKSKKQTRMMRRDRSVIDDEVLVENVGPFSYAVLETGELSNIFMRSLVLHTRKKGSAIYKKANNQKDKMSVFDLTEKELKTYDKFERVSHQYLTVRDWQDVFICSLVCHTRRPESNIYQEAKKGQRARIAISDLTEKELKSVTNFVKMVVPFAHWI